MSRIFKIFLLILISYPVVLISGQEKSPGSDSFINPVNSNTDRIKINGYSIKGILKDSIPENAKPMHYELRSDRFLDSLKSITSRNKWMRELTNIIILPPDSMREKDTLSTRRSETYFIRYEGFIIRNINFLKLDVFGPDNFDTTYVNSEGQLIKILNDLHIKTSDKVLERHLLFKSGDRIDARVLSDNERLLRELSFIEDARIILKQVEGSEGYVDITVIVRDRASKAFYPELRDIDAGKLEVWDKNIFGSGNEFKSVIHWNESKSKMWGYEGVFINRNIYGSFIDGQAEYRNVFQNETFGLQFNRKFFTPNTKYAGGISAFRTSTVKTIRYYPFSEERVPIIYNKFNFWIGKSILLNKNSSVDKNRLDLIFASRYYKEKYFERPDVALNSFYEYHNKDLWLNSVALISQSFYRTNLIYSYGRTEDIPKGYHAGITFGPEYGEFQNRFYLSFNLSAGYYLFNIGYLYANYSHGSFHTKSGNTEQGMNQFKMQYFSNLFVLRRFKYRQFVGINYIRGINRFSNEVINLDDHNGIRGFYDPTVYGKQKLVLNLETVFFTPYYLLGFRFVTFGFLDLGKIGTGERNVMKEDLYSGIGFGIRIQNKRLVFPTFQLRFAFYPSRLPVSIYDLFTFMGESNISPYDFYFKNPSLLDYK